MERAARLRGIERSAHVDEFVECIDAPDDPDACPMCTGEACVLCNLPAETNDVLLGRKPRCDHDVIDRHRRPGARE